MQEDIFRLNRPTVSNETEALIKSFATNKSPRTDVFTVKFYQTFKLKLTPMLLKLFHKIEQEGT
jgi:hypothetical protein